MEVFNTFSLLLIAALIFGCLLVKNSLSYWSRRGLDTPPYSLLFGHMKSAFTREIAFIDRMLKFYRYFKSMGLRHGGLYFVWSPVYMPLDLNIIKHITQIDFQHFHSRGLYSNEKNDPLSGNLFTLEGKKWKLLRHKLTPTFSSGKMKMMFPTMVECTKGLHKVIDKELGGPVDIKDILGRFTTDIIGSCAFGLDCNSLENPDSEFRKKGKSILHRKGLENFKQAMFFTLPNITKRFNVFVFPVKVTEFFMKIVKDTVTYREEHNVLRKDFMDLLIQLKNKGKLVDDDKWSSDLINEADNKITMNEIAAQVVVFFFAGFETSATTMSFCLYEVSKNKSIQDRIREEIRRVLQGHDGKLTYEALMEMSYLDQVVNETLRKYPPVPGLPRICNKDYKVPGTDLVLEKGVRVMISVAGIHHDPDYYADPEKFDPDRFSEDNKKNLTPNSFLPFGEGPRYCIGARFGLMQTKVGLVALLLNYELSINKKTQEPLQFDPEFVVASTKGGLWLDFKKISNMSIH
ncbi:hypothetical protein WA026_009039 [Henosepilachna vigintioctopunctata]|uniref:Cytochrome P450 n=1 Tax=Henosepilachna vigintioctopunctata TaxID=420089 RepID=A0AAW1UWF6_9CUCU